MNRNLIIIGGGAAGLTAALFAARQGCSVSVLEHTDRLGFKLSITGKGRCNLTNACPEAEFTDAMIHGGKFMRSALASFKAKDTVALFESLGIPSHIERGERVFPDCEDAKLVVSALVDGCKKAGVQFCLKAKVKQIITEGLSATEGAKKGIPAKKVLGVLLENGQTLFCDALLLATGGKSYPKTGSDGSGYALATSLGHTLISPRPALVPLICPGRDCADMMGLSLKNVLLTVTSPGKKKPVFSELGEMLFTHFGISGPLVLSASSYMEPGEEYSLSINWKPALSDETLDRRILREIETFPAKNLANLLRTLLPASAVPIFLRRLNLDSERRSDSLTRKERADLRQMLFRFSLPYGGLRPMDEGIITSGGIKLSEVDPKTMMSKLCSNFYFAGEVLDIDALTGGFNLQIAFSTAYAAAKSMSEELFIDDLIVDDFSIITKAAKQSKKSTS